MFPNVYEICLLYPHVFVIAYNATLVSHSSLSQHNSCHPCFLNALITSLSLGPLLHSLLCVSLIFFVFFLLSFPASLSAFLSPFSSSASSCFLPASFSSFFSLFSFYTTISSPCVDYLFYVCPLFSHPLLPPFHHLCGRLNQRPSPDGGRFSLFLSKALLMVVIQPLFSRLSSLSGAVRCLFIGSCLYLQHCLLSTSGCLRLFVG